MRRFIVAEVSKNWPEREAGLLSESFEHIIEVNGQRGYRLVTFSLHRLLTGPDAMNETIIAVFERSPEEQGTT